MCQETRSAPQSVDNRPAVGGRLAVPAFLLVLTRVGQALPLHPPGPAACGIEARGHGPYRPRPPLSTDWECFISACYREIKMTILAFSAGRLHRGSGCVDSRPSQGEIQRSHRQGAISGAANDHAERTQGRRRCRRWQLGAQDAAKGEPGWVLCVVAPAAIRIDDCPPARWPS